jgi:pyrrolidone-carboxylate peptidase
LLVLHLGVDWGEKTGVKLEAASYNEATFRIPDVRGAEPFEQPIDGQ